METKKKRRRKRNFSSDTDTNINTCRKDDETSKSTNDEIINNEPIPIECCIQKDQNTDLECFEKEKHNTTDEYYLPDIIERPYCLIL
jgi:hypothetical protein